MSFTENAALDEANHPVHPVMPELIVDEEVILTPFTAADYPVTDRLILEDRAHQAKYIDWVRDWSPETDLGREEKLNEGLVSGEMMPFKIVYKGQVVGVTGLHECRGTTAQLGYWLIERAEGHGVATRAARKLIEFGFAEKGLQTIGLHIKPDNRPSQKVAERLGASKTGEQVQEGESIHDVWEVSREFYL